MHLVEPSPYYYYFLEKNSSLIPGVEKIYNIFIAPTIEYTETKGILIHNATTANFVPNDDALPLPVMLPISQWAKSVELSSVLGCTKVLLVRR